MSLSARRAWIEIRGGYITKIDKDQSLSARRAWIEIILVVVRFSDIMRSLSARRAWIEMDIMSISPQPNRRVALRKESVDRNSTPAGQP